MLTTMNDPLDFEFTHRGRLVRVNRIHVPDEWLGVDDTLVRVTVDDVRVEVPNLLNAYRTAGKIGVELVITAFIDGASSPNRICFTNEVERAH